MIQKQRTENEIIYAFLSEKIDKAQSLVSAAIIAKNSSRSNILKRYFDRIETRYINISIELFTMRTNIDSKIPEFSFFD